MFELISVILFTGLVLYGVIYFVRFKADSDINAKINSPEVSTSKDINDLLLLAHRRAAAEQVENLSEKMIEIKSIDDELIKISKRFG